MRMRLMFTTALASTVMFAAPALAGGGKVDGTAGMTSPEASAAQLPDGTFDAGMLRESFATAGFTDWQAADDAQIFRMQTHDGDPVWVLLMPEGFQVGAAETGEPAMPGEPGDFAAAPDLPEADEQPDLAEAPDLPEAEGHDIAEAPDLPDERPDIAEAPDVTEPGIEAERPAVGHAARIDDELRSDLEGVGFEQIEDIHDAQIFRATTDDGRMAFVIVGDLETAGFGFDQPAPGLDQQTPGAAPDLPETTPGADGPQPSPGELQ